MRPGVTVLSREAAPPRGAPTNTGTAFFAGLTSKGPSNDPVLVRNMTQFVRVFGARVGAISTLYDAVDTTLRVGTSRVWVSRAVGPAAAIDTVTLDDAGAVDSIAVDSIGEYDSALTVEVVAGDDVGTFRLVIADDGTEVERSPSLADPAAAAAWSTGSDYVRVRALGENNPAVVAATALAGGDDDRDNVTDVERSAALAAFSKTLGPGQVAYPGATTATIHEALIVHAEANNRFALLDGVNDDDAAAHIAAAEALRDAIEALPGEPNFGAPFVPWVTVPGVVRNTTRTVPPSSVVAGLMALADTGGTANVPAAGAKGEVSYALGVSQVFTDAEHEELNAAGVNVIKEVFGTVRLYGYRTLADPETDPTWLGIGNQRLRMQITAEADELGEEFVFAQIDGRGVKIAEFGGALTGLLQRYYTLGSLYGETPDEAYRVDVGPGVNTVDSIANGELRAVLALRMSPFAEEVIIEIVKVPITEPV